MNVLPEVITGGGKVDDFAFLLAALIDFYRSTHQQDLHSMGNNWLATPGLPRPIRRARQTRLGNYSPGI